jgi:hypothetical protein
MAELNELLVAACGADLQRTIIGRSEPVGMMLDRERLLLAGLSREAHCVGAVRSSLAQARRQ